MSKGSDRLVRDMATLVDTTERFRSVLMRYTKVSKAVAVRVERGELLAETLGAVKGAVQRREVTEAMSEFEEARHRVRLAMFALGEEQGTSLSELGRQLGFSRQLASRLAAEAKEVLS